MKIHSDVSVVDLAAIRAGDLVILRRKSTQIPAIHLEDHEGQKVIGLLEGIPEYTDYPIYIILKPADTFVLSHGQDWVIEPVFGPESWVGNNSQYYARGALVLDGKDHLIRFDVGPDSHSGGDVWFNLASKTVSDGPSRQAVPIFNWLIWANDDTRKTYGAKPVATIKATAR